MDLCDIMRARWEEGGGRGLLLSGRLPPPSRSLLLGGFFNVQTMEEQTVNGACVH